MKKVLTLVLCIALSVFTLVGCSSTEEPAPTPTPEQNQQETPMDETNPSDAEKANEKMNENETPAVDSTDKPAESTK